MPRWAALFVHRNALNLGFADRRAGALDFLLKSECGFGVFEYLVTTSSVSPMNAGFKYLISSFAMTGQRWRSSKRGSVIPSSRNISSERVQDS